MIVTRSQQYSLNANMRACWMDSAAVLLNVDNGQYLSLSPEHSTALRRCLFVEQIEPTQLSANDDAYSGAIDELLNAKILVCGPASYEAAPVDDVPVRDSFSTAAPSLSNQPIDVAHWYALIRAYVHVSALLKKRRLPHILDDLQRRKQSLRVRHGCSAEERAFALAHGYWRLRPFALTAQNHCLVDSLVMAHYLARLGVSAKLVLGVCSRPFAAHAWVQFGDVVLNDSAEIVQQYTPIVTC